MSYWDWLRKEAEKPLVDRFAENWVKEVVKLVKVQHRIRGEDQE